MKQNVPANQLKIDFNVQQDIPITKENKKVDTSKIIETLSKKLESTKKKAEDISTDVHGNWTRKRQGEADRRYNQKQALLKECNVLSKLIALWQDNNVPTVLQKIRSSVDVGYILGYGYPEAPTEDHPIDGWYRRNYPERLKKATSLGLTSFEDGEEARKLIMEFSTITITKEEQMKIDLQNRLKKIRGSNIAGFFPTPDDVIDTMIYYSAIEDGMSILEPSAGIGSIPDRVKYKGYNVNFTCVERMYSLYEILSLKGYKSIQDDILEWDSSGEQFDRILMNPPFENGQDVQHITHCFNKYLKTGGILVAIASASIENNTQSKYKEFREFLEEQNATINHNGQVFKEAFNSTGVSTVTIILTKWKQ